ncbi:MAG: PAS domain-containing protein [Verrucomicrobiota bacterium]
MKKCSYQEAKKIIQPICKAAMDGEYDTREKFYDMLAANPDVAAQGYNAFGKIFFWNQASTRLYGRKESDAINQDLFDLVIPEDVRQLARDLIIVASKTGKTPEASSCDLIHNSGGFVTVFSGHLIFNWDGPATPEFYCIDIGINPESAHP